MQMLLTMGSQNAAAASTANMASARSILTTMNTFVKAVNDMDDTILIPSRLLDMAPPHTSDPSSAVMVSSAIPGSDLYSFYQMLNAIKHELVAGPDMATATSGEEDDDDKDVDDDGSQDSQSLGSQDSQSSGSQDSQVAAAFRHHLQGLFGVLKQLTGTAKYLTTRYQEEIGDMSTPPGKNHSSFML